VHPEIVAKCGERDLEPDVSAIAKAVGDGLGRRRQVHAYAFDRAPLGAMGSCPAAGPHNLELRVRQLRRACAPVDHDPDRVRRFRGETMDLERTEQAHDRVGHALRDAGDRVQLGDRSAREAVESAIHLFEEASLGQTSKIGAWDVLCVEITRADGPLAGDAKQRAGLAGGHDT
jgi:hypothetical protein